MPAHTPAIEALTQRIEGLEPSEVQSEISPLVQYGSNRLLTAVMHEGSLDSNIDLLRAIGNAANRSNDEETISSLTTGAVKSVTSVLSENRYKPIAVTRLVHEAEVLNDSIASPETRSSNLANIAGAMLEATGIPDTRVGFGYRAVGLLDKAAETAAQIDPENSKQQPSFVIGSLAEQATEQVLKLEGIVYNGMEAHEPVADTEHLRELAHEQPVRLFEAASAAVRPAGNEEARDNHALARKMIRAASAVKPRTNPELHNKLSTMATAEIDKVIAAYKDPTALRKLKPSKKAQILTGFGAELLQDIDEKYFYASDGEVNFKQLTGKALEVFELAHKYALQTKAKSSNKFFFKDSGSDILSAYSVSTAAQRLLDSDFDTAKRLFEISYDMAQIQDAGNESRRRGNDTHDVLEAIESSANQADDIGKQFEILAIGFHLEGKNAGEGRQTFMMGRSARSALCLAQTSTSSSSIKLEDIDRGFLEFTINEGATASANSFAHHLSRLRNFVRDPALKAQIDEAEKAQLEIAAEKERQRKKPKSHIEELAIDITASRIY